ncbi:MAG: hypothetical protein WBQ69_13940 [Gallionella sp.]
MLMAVSVSPNKYLHDLGGHYHVEQNIGNAGYSAWISIEQGFIDGEETVARLRQSNQRECNLAGVPRQGSKQSTIAIWYSNRPNGIAASSNRKGTVGYE